ncbi:hypothetical protein QBZ16_004787 [Prototheca wickerhamii]|uniref:Exocyst subunit Exo70 family protein n=1 Tax=Prototheca wickerhamii TaxID=3111 RepID=A0AAD9IFA5_PROWI|nr:hypothetical protein QBZ16_004787 [Prototheca wickerhamii]
MAVAPPGYPDLLRSQLRLAGDASKDAISSLGGLCRVAIAQGPGAGQQFVEALVAVHHASAALQRGRQTGLPGVSSSEAKAAAALHSQALLAAQSALQTGLASGTLSDAQRKQMTKLVDALVRVGQTGVVCEALREARAATLSDRLSRVAEAEAEAPPGFRIAAMLGALSEAARQELTLVTQVTSGEPALAALSAMLAPPARDIASLVQADVLAQPASLGEGRRPRRAGGGGARAARAVLETLRLVASAEDAAGCEACSALRGLEQGALASARRLWRFLEQPGGTGPPDARIAFPPDAASNELAEATAAALRRIARVPELGDIFFEQAAGAGPFAAAASGPGRLLASVTSVLDGVLSSVELGARKAYPRESGLAELHVLNSAETLAQELGRTETVAALAATWLAASETRAMLWADSYLSTAWGPALRGLREDAAQRPRGSALLPDAERAAVKVVWTAINKALDTALGQPAIVESAELRAKLQKQLRDGFLTLYRQFVTKYEAGQYTKGKRSKYERYTVEDVATAFNSLLTGTPSARPKSKPVLSSSSSSFSDKMSRFRSFKK